jgi:hypothetical protein
MKFSRLNRIIHRDLGYFFVGMFLIYAISGIVLNHRATHNPNFKIERTSFNIKETYNVSEIDEQVIQQLRQDFFEDGEIKNFHVRKDGFLRIYLTDGLVDVDLNAKKGVREKLIKRPVIAALNMLHYNKPGTFFTLFSDLFAVCSVLITLSGVIMIPGKKGLRGRGVILMLIGILIPVLIIIFH